MNNSILKALSATFCLVIIAGATQAASDGLAEVKDRKGLKIDSKRVKYRGSASLPATIAPQEGEIRVPTTNPRVIALIGYESKTGACRLRLFSSTGKALSEIHCESSFVVIPEGRDLVWIAGKVRREGFVEHGKQSPSSGLHLYDFRGQKLLSLAKEEIGPVGLLHALNDGSVIFTSRTDNFKGITKVTTTGTVDWRLPTPEPITNLRVFSDGRFFATQSIFMKEGISKAVLYGPKRIPLKERSGSHEESPEFLAVTPDARHFVLATAHGRKQALAVFSTADPERPIRQLEIDARLGKMEVDDNLHIMALQVFGIGPQGEPADGFRLTDSDGETIAEQQCNTARRESLRIGKDQRSVSWSCDSEHVELEANGETP